MKSIFIALLCYTTSVFAGSPPAAGKSIKIAVGFKIGSTVFAALSAILYMKAAKQIAAGKDPSGLNAAAHLCAAIAGFNSIESTVYLYNAGKELEKP